MHLVKRRLKDGRINWHVRDGTSGKLVANLGSGLTPDQARRRLLTIQREATDTALGYGTNNITLSTFVEDNWLPTRLVAKRFKTYERSRGDYRAHLKARFGTTPMRHITLDDVEKFLTELRPKSAWVARHAHATLRKILADAKRKGYVPRNVALDVDPDLYAPPRGKALPASRIFSVDELCVTLAAADLDLRTAILTTALEGPRWGEMAALREGDINFDLKPPSGYGEATMRIERSRPASLSIEVAPKSAAGIRTVDVLWPVRQALLDRAPRDGRFFTAPEGGPLHHKDFSTKFRKLLTDLGLRTPTRRLNWHSLRHTYASLMLAFGRAEHYIANQMGHSSTKLVWDTYGHLMHYTGKLDEQETLRKLWEAYISPAPQRRVLVTA